MNITFVASLGKGVLYSLLYDCAACVTYMWVGNSLHWQGWRQGVLYGAGGCRGVGPQDDRVRPGALHLLRPHHHPGTLGGHGAWVGGARGRPIPRTHSLLVLLVGL